MDHANPLPSSLGMESAQKPQRSFLLRYFLALVMPFLITMGLVLAYSQYATQLHAGVSSVQSKKIIRVDDGTFGLSPIGSAEEFSEVLAHLTPTPRIVADMTSSPEANLSQPAPLDPFAPAIIDLQKSLLPSPAKLLADGSTLYASQNGKTYVLTSTSGKDPRQVSIIPEGGTLLSSPDGLFILSAEAPGSSRLSVYQTNDPTKPTKLWTLTTSQTSRITFSTLYKGELILGISSSLTTDHPCAMTIATVDDKPVHVDCATILHPTTPFVPDSILTLLKMRPVTAEVISSFSSFVRKETSDSLYLGSDSIYLPYPLAQRTGIAQISLSELNIAHNLQIKGHLISPGGLHELSDSKLVAVTDSSRSNEWNLTISYPGSSPVPPPEVFQKAVGQASMYLAQNHLYLPPAIQGEPYQIIDFATDPGNTIVGTFETKDKNLQLFQLDNTVYLMVGLKGSDAAFTLIDTSFPSKPVKKSEVVFEKSKTGINTMIYTSVVYDPTHTVYLRDLTTGYLFSFTPSGTLKLLKALPGYTSDNTVIVGSMMYLLSPRSLDNINLGNYVANKVLPLN